MYVCMSNSRYNRLTNLQKYKVSWNLCNSLQRDNPTGNLNKVIINIAENKDFVDKS